MDIITNPIWTFIFGLAAVAGVWIAWRDRKRKELSYAVMSSAPFVHESNGNAGKLLKVTYAGREVNDVSLIVVRVWNSGNETIEESDFRQAIVLTFGHPTSQVLLAEVPEHEKVPANLMHKMHFDSTQVKLGPMLLNPSDALTVRVVVTAFPGKVDGEARISGVKELRRREAGEIAMPSDTRNAAIVSGISIVGFVLLPLLIAVVGRQFLRETVIDTVDNVISAQVSIGFGLMAAYWYASPKKHPSYFRPWVIREWRLAWVGAIVVLYIFLVLVLLPYVNSLLPH